MLVLELVIAISVMVGVYAWAVFGADVVASFMDRLGE